MISNIHYNCKIVILKLLLLEQNSASIIDCSFQSVAQEEAAAQSFYQTYYTDVLQHLFSVVTDSSHIAGLGSIATILAYMFNLVDTDTKKVVSSPGDGSKVVESPKIAIPLDPKGQAASNMIFVQEFLLNLLKSAFPHLNK